MISVFSVNLWPVLAQTALLASCLTVIECCASVASAVAVPVTISLLVLDTVLDTKLLRFLRLLSSVRAAVTESMILVKP